MNYALKLIVGEIVIIDFANSIFKLFFISFCGILINFCKLFTSGCDSARNDFGCCEHLTNECDVGEGDCDGDWDCVGDLVCGSNNCQALDPAWSNYCFDCCTIPSKKNHTKACKTSKKI